MVYDLFPAILLWHPNFRLRPAIAILAFPHQKFQEPNWLVERQVVRRAHQLVQVHQPSVILFLFAFTLLTEGPRNTINIAVQSPWAMLNF